VLLSIGSVDGMVWFSWVGVFWGVGDGVWVVLA
jgi:hypothetical protein